MRGLATSTADERLCEQRVNVAVEVTLVERARRRFYVWQCNAAPVLR